MKRNNMIVYLLLVVATLIIAIPLAGCVGSGSTAGTTAVETTGPNVTNETNPATKNEILIESNTFKPDSLTIKVGDTVTWVNNDSYNHTVTSKTGEFDSSSFGDGATFSFTFDKEGTYDYICSIHTFMTGRIIVTN